MSADGPATPADADRAREIARQTVATEAADWSTDAGRVARWALEMDERVAELTKDRASLVAANHQWHLRVGSLLSERDSAVEKDAASEAEAARLRAERDDARSRLRITRGSDNAG